MIRTIHPAGDIEKESSERDEHRCRRRPANSRAHPNVSRAPGTLANFVFSSSARIFAKMAEKKNLEKQEKDNNTRADQVPGFILMESGGRVRAAAVQ